MLHSLAWTQFLVAPHVARTSRGRCHYRAGHTCLESVGEVDRRGEELDSRQEELSSNILESRAGRAAWGGVPKYWRQKGVPGALGMVGPFPSPPSAVLFIQQAWLQERTHPSRIQFGILSLVPGVTLKQPSKCPLAT